MKNQYRGRDCLKRGKGGRGLIPQCTLCVHTAKTSCAYDCAYAHSASTDFNKSVPGDNALSDKV